MLLSQKIEFGWSTVINSIFFSEVLYGILNYGAIHKRRHQTRGRGHCGSNDPSWPCLTSERVTYNKRFQIPDFEKWSAAQITFKSYLKKWYQWLKMSQYKTILESFLIFRKWIVTHFKLICHLFNVLMFWSDTQ